MDKTIRLIEEPYPLRKERKGGAASLMLAAQMLEACRMKDDGMEIPHIDAVATTTFGIPTGFLARMDEIGIVKTCEYLSGMADETDAEDPIFQKYFNFFTPARSLAERCEKGREAGAAPLWKAGAVKDAEPKDFMVVDLLKKRFQAVAFITATEIVEEEILEMAEVEKLCREGFGWREGPFAMMNRMGIAEAMRKVTEKMEMSHRQEINFPITNLLITQANKDEPWPLNSKIQ
ncbi:MAG: 3-hydroxyacyl-CoA dehydrogenase family protein [Candidatus Aminicenantaceae bacterium]|jgi:3-hydroxyacyl-CoA dehydrogenase